MLDFGWTELLMIGIVAVVVIGPKDLPKAMADLAGWIRKLRGLATDFQGQVNEMVKGTELEEVQKAARGLNQYNIKRQLTNTIDPKGQMKKALEETRQAATARAAPPVPAATATATPGLASSSGMVEAADGPAEEPGPDDGATLAANETAVRAMGGAPAAEPGPAAPAKPGDIATRAPRKPRTNGAGAKAAKAAKTNGESAPAGPQAKPKRKTAAKPRATTSGGGTATHPEQQAE